MRVSDIENTVFDQVKNDWDSAGTTGNNMNVDYHGLRVLMQPSMFLTLSTALEPWSDYDQKMLEYLVNGGTIGSPFLIIRIPEGWEENDFKSHARVVQHEGRHRMRAIDRMVGDVWVETHLFFGSSIRNRHITPKWIENLNQAIYPQGSRILKSGPIFRLV